MGQLMKRSTSGRETGQCAVDCSSGVRRERATVRSTIYNQMALHRCACVRTLCTAPAHARGPERGNDVHEVLSLITRFASAPAARTTAERPPFVPRELFSLFTSGAAMHAAPAIVSSTVRRTLHSG
ncbi:unnamed protein product, partial [Iphiclides podalirius]